MNNLPNRRDINLSEIGKEEEKLSQITFDEAILRTGYGKFHIILLLLCGGCLMGVMTETIGMGFLLPSAKCDLHFSLGEQGILNSVSLFGVVISSHFWGFLADTWGRLKVLRLALIGSITLSIVSSFSMTTWFLIVTRLIVGIMISGTAATTYAYFGEFHSEKRRARAISFMAMFNAAALIFLPGLGWLIIPMNLEFEFYGFIFNSWRIYLLSCCSVNVIAAIGLFFLPESPKFLLNQNNMAGTMEVLRIVFSCNNNLPKEFYNVESHMLINEAASNNNSSSITSSESRIKQIAIRMWQQTYPLFKLPFLLNIIKACVIMFGIFSVSSGFFMWLPEFITRMNDFKNYSMPICEVIRITMEETNHSNETINSKEINECSTDEITFQIVLIMGIWFTLCFILIGVVINIIGRKLLLTIWLLVSALTVLSVTWISNFYAFVILVALFVSVGACGSVLSAISVDLFPTRIRAMALCIIMMFGRLGAVVGSTFIGQIILLQCNLIFFAYAAFLIGCVLVTITLPKKMPNYD